MSLPGAQDSIRGHGTDVAVCGAKPRNVPSAWYLASVRDMFINRGMTALQEFFSKTQQTAASSASVQKGEKRGPPKLPSIPAIVLRGFAYPSLGLQPTVWFETIE